jgi:GNAT superfamily N-acetyltransferase
MAVTYTGSDEIELTQLARLFDDAGWSSRTVDQERFAALIKGSRFVVSAWDGDALVGFARAISDGVKNAYVTDVVVRADHRRQGIGAELVRRLLAGRDDIKFVLRADPELRRWYAAFGFVEAPNMLVRDRRAPPRPLVEGVPPEPHGSM